MAHEALAAIVSRFHAGGMSAELAVMLLLLAGEDLEAARVAVAGNPALAEVLEANAEGCARIVEMLKSSPHPPDPAASIEEGIAYARRLFDATVAHDEESSVSLYSLPAGSADLVLAVDVFPYLVQAGAVLVDTIVADIVRVLAPDGRVVLFNFSYCGDPARDRQEVAELARRPHLELRIDAAHPLGRRAVLPRRARIALTEDRQPAAGEDLAMVLLIVWGCGRAEQAPPMPVPGHATEWDALVAAADRRDLQTVQVLARDLSLGDVPDDDPAAEKLGGALGFLQLVDDPEDLGPAVARASAACAECHRARGIP